MSAAREMGELFMMRWLQRTALGTWLALILWRSLALELTVRDLDNWWHLQVGSWILARHSFPHAGIFSATAANRPWAAYSWGDELLLSLAYKWSDLNGMAVVRKKPINLFKAGTLALATIIGFRMMRDPWFLCIVAAACIADASPESAVREQGETWYDWSGPGPLYNSIDWGDFSSGTCRTIRSLSMGAPICMAMKFSRVSSPQAKVPII